MPTKTRGETRRDPAIIFVAGEELNVTLGRDYVNGVQTQKQIHNQKPLLTQNSLSDACYSIGQVGL